MSEKNLDNSYFSIPDDAMIDIKVSGKFYTDLKKVFTEHITDGEDKESMGVRLTNISQNKISDMKDYRLLLMYTMINQLEAAALEQNLAQTEQPSSPKSPEN